MNNFNTQSNQNDKQSTNQASLGPIVDPLNLFNLSQHQLATQLAQQLPAFLSTSHMEQYLKDNGTNRSISGNTGSFPSFYNPMFAPFQTSQMQMQQKQQTQNMFHHQPVATQLLDPMTSWLSKPLESLYAAAALAAATSNGGHGSVSGVGNQFDSFNSLLFQQQQFQFAANQLQQQFQLKQQQDQK
jgi:hypothetical protein